MWGTIILTIGEIKDSVLQAYKLASYLKKIRLSREEKELLISALPDGDINLFRLNEGNFIRAGNKNFPDDKTSNPADFEKYFEALKRLEQRGYVRHETGILHKLTASGFKKAKKLARKKQR